MAKVYSMTKCNDIKYVDDKEVVYLKDIDGAMHLCCQTEHTASFIVNFLTSTGIYKEDWDEGVVAPYFEALGYYLVIYLLPREWEIFKENLGLFDIILEEMRDD